MTAHMILFALGSKVLLTYLAKTDPTANEMSSEILECPIDAFLNYYAPFVPSTKSIENALQVLKDNQSPDRSLEEVDGDKRFWTWPNLGPGSVKSDADEITVFGPLQQFVKFLEGVECCEKGGKDDIDNLRNRPRNREFYYRDCPSATIKSEILGADFQVDACITSNPNSEDVILSDTAVIAEFQKDTTATNVWDVSYFTLREARELIDSEKNRLELVSAAGHILNSDPCRTWVYGVSPLSQHTMNIPFNNIT